MKICPECHKKTLIELETRMVNSSATTYEYHCRNPYCGYQKKMLMRDV
jgi:hypothetical protein